MGMNCRRLRNLAGLASVSVPFAIAVHLIAEVAAVGRGGLGLDFVARHSYFGALVLVAAGWFGATVGIAQGNSERRRRCAILRADLGGVRRPQGFALLAGAQLAFFAATQGLEGVPIAAGAVVLALCVAVAGSLLSAFVVFFFGRSLIVAGLDSVIGTTPLGPAAITFARREPPAAAPRRATSAFSLFIPNRPPPMTSQT
jgi:hypothetical protein